MFSAGIEKNDFWSESLAPLHRGSLKIWSVAEHFWIHTQCQRCFNEIFGCFCDCKWWSKFLDFEVLNSFFNLDFISASKIDLKQPGRDSSEIAGKSYKIVASVIAIKRYIVDVDHCVCVGFANIKLIIIKNAFEEWPSTLFCDHNVAKLPSFSNRTTQIVFIDTHVRGKWYREWNRLKIMVLHVQT